MNTREAATEMHVPKNDQQLNCLHAQVKQNMKCPQSHSALSMPAAMHLQKILKSLPLTSDKVHLRSASAFFNATQFHITQMIII